MNWYGETIPVVDLGHISQNRKRIVTPKYLPPVTYASFGWPLLTYHARLLMPWRTSSRSMTFGRWNLADGEAYFTVTGMKQETQKVENSPKCLATSQIHQHSIVTESAFRIKAAQSSVLKFLLCSFCYSHFWLVYLITVMKQILKQKNYSVNTV